MTLVNDPIDAYPAEPAEPWHVPFQRYGADRLLVLLAGAAAVGFGVLLFLIQLVGDTFPAGVGGTTGMGGAVFTFAVALTFGLLLLLAFQKMAVGTAEGAVLALAFSVVVLIFGGTAGMVAGILGLVGATLGLLKGAKWPA